MHFAVCDLETTGISSAFYQALQCAAILAAFADPRMCELGRRLVALHAPGLLTAEERSQFEAWLRHRWSAPNEPGIGWMGLARAQAVLEELRASATVDPDLVNDIDAYLQGFAQRSNG